jgi:hypothetical protein
MPSVIQADQIDGLIKTTQRHIVRDRKASIAERLTKYVGVKNLFRPNKKSVSDGYGIEWNIATDHSNTAMQVGLYDTIAPATSLHQVRANIPWRHTRAHVSWDLREIAMNRSPARILNIIKEKIFEMDVAWFEQLEDQIWRIPTAGDDQSIFGLLYWLFSPQDAGQTVSASTNASFFTSGTGNRVNFNLAAYSGGPGSVSRVTYGRLGNWYQQFASITYADLFAKMRTGLDEVDYESPMQWNKLMEGNQRFGIYASQAAARAAADEVRQQNENIGPDLAQFDGKATIRGTPIVGVPKIGEIDAGRTTAINPFYVIDWSQFTPVTLEGFESHEVTETGGANQPLTVTRARYMTWNAKCWNTKTLALFTTG